MYIYISHKKMSDEYDDYNVNDRCCNNNNNNMFKNSSVELQTSQDVSFNTIINQIKNNVVLYNMYNNETDPQKKNNMKRPLLLYFSSYMVSRFPNALMYAQTFLNQNPVLFTFDYKDPQILKKINTEISNVKMKKNMEENIYNVTDTSMDRTKRLDILQLMKMQMFVLAQRDFWQIHLNNINSKHSDDLCKTELSNIFTIEELYFTTSMSADTSYVMVGLTPSNLITNFDDLFKKLKSNQYNMSNSTHILLTWFINFSAMILSYNNKIKSFSRV